MLRENLITTVETNAGNFHSCIIEDLFQTHVSTKLQLISAPAFFVQYKHNTDNVRQYLQVLKIKFACSFL